MYATIQGARLGVLLLGLTAGVLAADQTGQDWIPEEIDLPQDIEVITDRAIGSSTRIFSFVTGEDPGALLDRWSAALSSAGYVLQEQPEAIETQQIEFSGPGIGNAKIAVQPQAGEETRSVVQFDASLDN